ncbi:hypothetical protein D3Z39_14525 [Anaerotruncus colihominis]|uniref:Uncharacterized protein n=1 Tax=Anaerotruncus colihominis TaxID=169435 RepID=A0A845RKD1_9FIRM|nr:hypothetical protein [Anaerotruncus colihominis]NBI80057.1 hypothetical protein [Anaerotruncus colihominis]
MTNKEAYLSDLQELDDALAAILRAVPYGPTKKVKEARAEADRVADSARATIACMKRDYIIQEREEDPHETD